MNDGHLQHLASREWAAHLKTSATGAQGGAKLTGIQAAVQRANSSPCPGSVRFESEEFGH